MARRCPVHPRRQVWCHPTRPPALTTLGNALLDAHGRDGDRRSLDDAVEAYRAALAEDAGTPQYPVFLTGLATAHSARYDLDGDLVDLREAVRLGRMALDRTDEQDPPWPSRASNLGSFLWTSSARTNWSAFHAGATET